MLQSLLPTTSVHSTKRIIVGATAEWLQAARGDFVSESRGHIFKYDVQINNARAEAVRVLDMYWEFTDANGKLTFHRGAANRPGEGSAAAPTLKPGGAYRGPYTIGMQVRQNYSANSSIFGRPRG